MSKRDGLPGYRAIPSTTGRPFLRWAGGKSRLTHQLIPLLPELDGRHCYYEPFLGGASLFLRVRPTTAILGDLNADLIGSYRAVRDSPELVARYVAGHARRNSREYYYRVRDSYNRLRARTYSAAQAARFIYLNRTSFNGIFRVSKGGIYNVPFGKAKDAVFPSLDHLCSVSADLQAATLLAGPFAESLASARKGDFVYLDPPYPPLNGTSFFRHYTPDRFDDDDQKELSYVVEDLIGRGCLVMMSNADTADIRRLYRGLQMHHLKVRRYVSSQKSKHAVDEVVVTSYLPPRPHS